MWHLWAHVGSDGRTILGPELRADAIAYGFAELRADAVAYVFADPRADVAPELRADESPDLSADEQADGVNWSQPPMHSRASALSFSWM